VRTAAETARAAIADPAHAAYDAIVEPARATYEAIVAAARRDLDAIMDEAHGTLATLVQQADAARDEIIEDARDAIVAMEQPLVAEAETLITQINAEFDEVVPDPDQFDWPEPATDEWDSPLYNSQRTYVEQVDVYRAHRGDDEDVGLAADRIVTMTCQLCGKSFSFSASTVATKRKFCSERCRDKSSRNSVRARRDPGPSQKEQHDGGSGAAS
jgi:vacuolar-type H+-ATPase subunit H